MSDSSPTSEKAPVRRGRRLLVALASFTFMAVALALAVPFLPVPAQDAAVAAAEWAPGVRHARVAGTAPAHVTVVGGQPVITTAAAEAGSSVQVEAAGFVLAGLFGLTAGLLVGVAWAFPVVRLPALVGLLCGALAGLAIAAWLPTAPTGVARWAHRGLAGSWGVTEARSPAEAAGLRSELTSARGRLARHVLDESDRVVVGSVRVEARGQARFALHGMGLGLALALVVIGFRVGSWRLRLPLLVAGGALGAWLLVPFLPVAVGAGLLQALALLPLPSAAFVQVQGGVVSVTPALLLAFAAVLGIVLAPVAVAAAGMVAARDGLKASWTRRQDERARRAEEPAWLQTYEQARQAKAQRASLPH